MRWEASVSLSSDDRTDEIRNDNHKTAYPQERTQKYRNPQHACAGNKISTIYINVNDIHACLYGCTQ